VSDLRQATVARYDRATRTGTLLLDTGHVLVFPAAAVDPALLLLRLGQRVHVELAGDVVLRLSLTPLVPPR
jgi:hypothetical protein